MMKTTTVWVGVLVVALGCSGRRPASPATPPSAPTPTPLPSPTASVDASEGEGMNAHQPPREVPQQEPQRGRMCGGFAGLRCPSGQRCVDNPSDGCDPARGGRDCGGVCVPEGGDAGR